MVLRIGHRGAAGHEPENTLLSLKKAVELGCDMTEIDVHVCASGEVVVIHDEEVYRTTEGTGFVSQMSLDALKALDAGKGETIPTLEEVLSALKGKIQLVVELKGKGTPAPVHGILENSGWSKESLMVQSFDWNMLEEYLELDPEMRIGVLAHENAFHAARYASKVDAYCVNPLHHLIRKTFITKTHKKGLKIFPWTVNEPDDIARMKDFGVDGIISDFPDLI
ncbi:glycerophosphoryl diester phosphodiesterase [Candidatus Bathyarchaeota archaeon]|nr:glycerophosphoryl diester phosphodiesterase [Candidatus Bathyarchaeota archaeon]MBT5641930.1 glycerophosphoryl diester phosphodiesterase [Candidatus Bathyarchaeota archaeon]